MIFIGTMTSAESLWVDVPVWGRSIYTDVVYDVERNIHEAPETLPLRIPGGQVGENVSVTFDWPHPEVGERHYLALDFVASRGQR